MKANGRYALENLPFDVRSAVEDSRVLLARAEASIVKASNATHNAVRRLTALGLSTRAAGQLLGLSRQRVHQVLKAS